MSLVPEKFENAEASEGKRAYVRRFKRYGVDKRIRVISGQGRAQSILNGRCNVLSEGGFGAVIAGMLPEHSIVQIEFVPEKTTHPLQLAAEVRFCQGFHHGFEFVAPNVQQKYMISELFAESVQIG